MNRLQQRWFFRWFRRWATAIAVVGVGAFPARAHAGAIDDLRQFSKQTRSARGEFQQRTLKASGQSTDASSGRFAFAKPGLFRWEVRAPFEQLMVADGEKIYFFDKDLNQVTVRSLDDAVGATPAAILFGDVDLAESFTLKDGGLREGVEWIEARPKNKDAGFESISIGMKAGRPETMEVVDAFGRKTVFSFRQLESNPKIPPEQFKFTAPAGAEVVRQ